MVETPIVNRLQRPCMPRRVARIMRRMQAPSRRTCLLALLAAVVPAAPAGAQGGSATIDDDTWFDAARGGRAVPVRIRWPAPDPRSAARPVILFSHGLGGTRASGTVWGEAWADAGFVVVHLQHAGSDLQAVRADRQALHHAASPAQLQARLRDVGFVLDEIGLRHARRQPRWAGVRPDRVGMSGHSFGAHTTLSMAGQRFAGFDGVDEPRLSAFIAFSPSLPARGDAQQAFARIDRPMLTITGTRDEDVLGVGATPERRIAVFDALPSGHAAQLVLADADHMSFGGQTDPAAGLLRPRDAASRTLQPQHHALVARISTDWWRSTLLDDPAARQRLQAPAQLGPGDIWRRK